MENNHTRENAIAAEIHQQRRGIKNAFFALVVLTVCMLIAN